MAIDVNRALDADHGFLVNDPSSGNNIEGPFYTGGPSSPVGLNLPTRTFYVQNTGDRVILWQKFGNGVNDWKVFPATDIGFDPSNVDITATDVQAAIETQANRHYGKDFEENTAEYTDNTSGGSFKIYDIFDFTVSDTSALNKYKIESDFFWGHNSASNDIRVQLLVDGNVVATELRKEPKDAGSDQRIDGRIKGFAQNLAQGIHTVQLQYRPASANRTSRMYYSSTEIKRVQ